MYAQALEVCLTLEHQPFFQVRSKRLAAGKSVERIVRAAQVLGCTPMPAKHFKAISRLGQIGFFRAGGALSGPVAVHAYANMLGIKWSRGAAPKNVGNIDTLACLASPLRIEAAVPELRGKLQRVEHEDYLAEDLQQVLVMSNGRFVLANVVQPARYAMHTLLNETISKVDFARAVAVLTALLDMREFEVKRACQAFAHRSAQCEQNVWAAMRRTEAKVPELFGSLDF